MKKKPFNSINGMAKVDKKKYLTVFFFIVIVLLLIAAIFTLVLWPKTTRFVAEKYSQAAVATDSEICTTVGARILKRNGSVIDATIATVLCAGIANPQSCGIGGDSLLVYYDSKKKKIKTYDFRSTAPSSINSEFYTHHPYKARNGGSSIAVPGQIKGLWYLHKKYGRLKWSKLIEPAIKLAEEGIPVTNPIYYSGIQVALLNKRPLSPGLRKMFSHSSEQIYEIGDIMRNPQLAETLRKIQKDPESFYKGELAKDIIEDVRDAGGNMTLEDLKNYKIIERPAFSLPLLKDNMTFYTMSVPGGGPIASMILNIMKGYHYTGMDFANPTDRFTFHQRLIESMKFSYAQRGYFGDPDFIPERNISRLFSTILNTSFINDIRENKIHLDQTHPPFYYGGSWGKEDHGTSHLSILGGNGDAVSVTSTINDLFGSLIRSEKTGIIYNNAMEDFSIPGFTNLYDYPPSIANYISPSKRPLSSLCPSIVLDDQKRVKMVVGAAGGSRAISGTSEVILKVLFLGMELGKAVSSFRLHNQGIPNEISYNRYQKDIDHDLLEKLQSIGHKVKERPSLSVVQAIYQDDSGVYAMTDPMKSSKPDGF